MAFSVETLRSGIGAIAQDARIVAAGDEIKAAGLKHRIACCFGSSSARAANRATIDSIKMAALEDPRYSNIRDDVEKIFGGMDCRRTLSAGEIKAAFSKLDEMAFNSESGRASFLKEEVKLRLMAQALSCANAPVRNDSEGWKFSFEAEWSRGSETSSAATLPRWTMYMKKLEPLIEQRIGLLAHAKGGHMNLSTADIQGITADVHNTLKAIASECRRESLPERHQHAALELTMNVIFSKSNAIFTDRAVMDTAAKVADAVAELYQISTDYDCAQGIVEQGIEWMGKMESPLDCDSTLRLFARNREAFRKALDLDLSPRKAQNLTQAMMFEHLRTNGNADLQECVERPSSALRKIMHYENLTESPHIYSAVASILESPAISPLHPQVQMQILESISRTIAETNSMPMTAGNGAPALKIGNMEISWKISPSYGYGYIAQSEVRETLMDAA